MSSAARSTVGCSTVGSTNRDARVGLGVPRGPTRVASALVARSLVAALLVALLLPGAGCAGDPPSPFAVGAGGAGGLGGGSGAEGGSSEPDPTLGGPCTVDEQCDDGFDCTFDACDQEILRCRFLPDDSQCQNGIYCDGLEICDNKLGCRLGEPVTCSDGNPCTINTCDEATGDCLSVPRDVDQDGDPDEHCGGGDCDDLDPKVSSTQDEVCDNLLDDDCDGTVDEAACVSPANDTCLDPLLLMQPGTYPMSTAGAGLDYASSCGVDNTVAARDVVAALEVPGGQLHDIQLTVIAGLGDVATSLLGQCDQPASEIACSNGFDHPAGGRVAKARGRSQGDLASALLLPAYVFADASTTVTFRYELLPASLRPDNQTCGTALPLAPSTPTVASVVDATQNLSTACDAQTGDLVYAFTLAEPQDVELFGVSSDGDGLPVLSLRNASCALPEDEITCAQATVASSSAYLYRHSLPAGDYFVGVAATAPTDVIVSLELSPPTPAPADETCSGSPAIPINQTIDALLAPHQDDIDTGCLAGGADAAFALDLAVPSDVLLLARYSAGDVAAVALAEPGCTATDVLVCAADGTQSPERARKRNVAPGSYRVVVESQQNQPMLLTALVRPAVPPTLVPFANACGDVLTIPQAGGFFQGNTANAQADFDAGCDQGGQPIGGAPDQLLKLTLTAEKRVVLDMQGSAYATLLDVREGPACPGMEMPFACAAGFYPERSFLDLTLPAATYFIQIDGYAGQSGPWFLDVHVVDPTP